MHKFGVSTPHTTHCLADGDVMISTLGTVHIYVIFLSLNLLVGTFFSGFFYYRSKTIKRI